MNKVTFIEKCLAKLNLSDDGKVGLAIDKIINSYEKQIKGYERKISDLKSTESEKLADLNEQLEELILDKNDVVSTIEPDKIRTSEERKAYVEIYSRKVNKALQIVKNKKEEIENYKESVKKEVEGYQEQIDLFKALLEEMN